MVRTMGFIIRLFLFHPGFDLDKVIQNPGPQFTCLQNRTNYNGNYYNIYNIILNYHRV